MQQSTLFSLDLDTNTAPEPVPVHGGNDLPPAPPENHDGDRDRGDDHGDDDRGDRPPRYFYPQNRDRMPAGGTIQPGQRVYCGLYGGRYGIVYRINGEQRPETIGTMGGGCVSYGGRADICTVWDSGVKDNGVPESVVRGVQWEIYQSWATAEEIMNAIDYAKTCEEKRQQEARDQAAREAAQLAEDMAAEGTRWITADELRAKAAAVGAKRIIWAQSDEDDSDIMTDYHNHKTTRSVVIGFATASRESFPALRKAAAMFPPTSHLAPGRDCWALNLAWDHNSYDSEAAGAWLKNSGHYYKGSFLPVHFWKDQFGFESFGESPKFATEAEIDAFISANPPLAGCRWDKDCRSFEHRENYSMGGGNYLKDGHRDSTGWKVSSDPVEYLKGFERVQFFEPVPAKSAAVAIASHAKPVDVTDEAAPPRSASGVTVTMNPEKNGIEIRFPAKPSADVLADLKAHGWRWSRFSACWYNRDTPTARAYAEQLAGTVPAAEEIPAASETQSEPPEQTTSAESTYLPVHCRIAEKLREKAESLTEKIEHLTRPLSQNATPKRLRELASRTIDGDCLRRVQTALRALADLWERGECPEILRNVRSAKEGMQLLRHKINHAGYYQVIDTGEFSDASPKARAMQELAEDPDALARKRARLLQSEIDKLRFCDIPGFFPTPPDICRRVVDLAEIDAAHRVLEPSAGIGSLADACPNRERVHCVEQWASLTDILSMKGYHITARDFLECDPLMNQPFDRVVMNPPFENSQDAAHVRHAFEFLKRGGRLVAIVGAGILQRSDRKATEFRAWLDDVAADRHDLPEDAFNGKDAFRRTATRAVILVIDKPE